MPAINSPTPDATTITKGKIQLAGDIGGTAAAPTVVRVTLNPYKFRVYRTAAFSTPNNTTGKLLFDTKSFDTGTNFDVVTNNRFTTPVAGFYHFDAKVSYANQNAYLMIYVNGVEVSRGPQIVGTAVLGAMVSDTLQLAASDYVEVFLFSAAVSTGSTGSNNTYFSGFLISLT